MENILKIEKVNTGGNVIVDAIYLKNGRVIVAIAEDAIAIYASEQAFENNEPAQVIYVSDLE